MHAPVLGVAAGVAGQNALHALHALHSLRCVACVAAREWAVQCNAMKRKHAPDPQNLSAHPAPRWADKAEPDALLRSGRELLGLAEGLGYRP